jgi:hypothetical protein
VPAGPERLLALSHQAIYALDGEARVLSRSSLPLAAVGTAGLVTSAAWDGVGLGLALRWPSDAEIPGGNYFALTEGTAAFDASSLMALDPPVGAARGDFDGQAHQVISPRVSGTGTALEIELHRVPREGARTSRLLASGLAPETQVGEWASDGQGGGALCTVEPDGQVLLRRFTAEGSLPPVEVGDPAHLAVGPCALASSGRTQLVVYASRPMPSDPVDARPSDGSLGALSFKVPVGRVVGPEGKATQTAPQRLSLLEGTVRVDGALWDGQRYVVLVVAAGLRGGRLLLAALDETGQLLYQDRVIPLSYEPGQLLEGRLSLGTGAYLLLYALQRPWDRGVLHLARLTVHGER